MSFLKTLQGRIHISEYKNNFLNNFKVTASRVVYLIFVAGTPGGARVKKTSVRCKIVQN